MVDRIELETGNNDTTDTKLPSEDKHEDGEKKYAGKYKTPEELEKGYLELQKKLGSNASDQDPDPAPAKEATDAIESTGLNIEKYSQEYEETGQLSEASYKELADAGLSNEMVNAYIAGQQAIIDKTNAEIFGEVGGEEQFNKMMAWAETNLTDADKNAYNNAMDSGDMAQIKMVVNAINARHIAETGSSPNLLSGTAPATGGDAYASKAEMVEDMKDPRYEKDPAYRKKVQDKLMRSDIF